MSLLISSTPLLIQGLFGSFLIFAFLWLIQCILKDAGWVDVGWTAGVGILAAAALHKQKDGSRDTVWLALSLLFGLLAS